MGDEKSAVPAVSVSVPKARPRWIWGAAALVGAGLIAPASSFFTLRESPLERPTQFTVSSKSRWPGLRQTRLHRPDLRRTDGFLSSWEA